jgi:hypothetical protein
MNYVLKTKDLFNEWNVILIYYVMDFLNSKNYEYFFLNLSILKLLFFKKLFWDYFICLIASWFEIGNGKNRYFQYHLNIHILSQFSTTLEKDLEKGF